MHKPIHGLCAIVCAISTLYFNSAVAANAVNLRHQPLSFLNTLSADHYDNKPTLTEIQSDIDFHQTKHIRLQETVSGYPIWGADIIIHIPHGINKRFHDIMSSRPDPAIFMNGIFYKELDTDLKSKPHTIFNHVQSDKSLQQGILNFLTKHPHSQTLTQQQAREIVYIDHNQQANWAYLVSFVTTSDNGLPMNPTYIIDALSLKIYQEWDNIKTLSKTTGGGFGGNEKTGQFSYDGTKNNLPALDIQRNDTNQTCYLANSDVTVLDANHDSSIIHFKCNTPNHTHGNVYWNASHDAINGAYSPSNDALFIGKIVKDMYQKWYGIPVLVKNGKPMMLNMLVHFKIDNAFWDGQQMTFGDGIELFYPLVSLGVGAHEISHGFTQQHSNLVYYGQSGALNESFSDMASQAAIYYSTQKNNWQIGDDILKAKNKALRYMDEPTKDCADKQFDGECSISNLSEYRDGLDVHHSSGIFNKFFYLISTSKGWDTQKAFNMMVHSNQHYWTSTSTFIDAACGVMQAAEDYHYSVPDVKRAAKQVGIDLGQC